MNPSEWTSHRKVNEETGCWEWTKAKDANGYGVFRMNGVNQRAHRMAAYLFLGHPLKDKLQVLHRCDNPSCFNPEHLFIGTPKDNMQDAMNKGRHWASGRKKQTHCKRGHEFTP